MSQDYDDYPEELINIPVLAALASLLVAGGGQLYNRRFGRAVVFLVGFGLAIYKVGLFAYVISIGSAVEALLVALSDARIRAGE